MQDPVRSIVRSVSGHLQIDDELEQAFSVKELGGVPGSNKPRHDPPRNARFARIRRADRVLLMQAAVDGWLTSGEYEPPNDNLIDGVVSRLVEGKEDMAPVTSREDVIDYYRLGKKYERQIRNARLYADNKPEAADKLYKLISAAANAVGASSPSQPSPLQPKAADEDFDPNSEKDARERIQRTIVQRRGQRHFRDSLISAYEGKCVITGCSILDILEAAHIIPYLGEHTDKISNGLLLRADLHTLFDCGLLAIDPETKQVLLAPRIKDSEYQDWCGRRIHMPKNKDSQPNKKALRKHLEDCKNTWEKGVTD